MPLRFTPHRALIHRQLDDGCQILAQLERALEREGHRPSRAFTGQIIDSDSLDVLKAHGAPNHWTVWTLDKLHDCVGALLRGEVVLAQRLLIAAHGYRGKAPGYWEAADGALRFVERIIEEILEGDDRGTECPECGYRGSAGWIRLD